MLRISKPTTKAQLRKQLEIELDKAHYPATKAQTVRNRKIAAKLAA